MQAHVSNSVARSPSTLMMYLHAGIAIPLIYLYTMVMGSLSLILSIYDPTGIRQHWCAQVWCQLIARTVGMRVTVHGRENLNLSRPAIYMANHQSYLDIPALFAYLPFQFRILAKKPLFYVPFMGWHLWRSGHIAVDRGNRNATPKMLKAAQSKLVAGVPIVVFPEGTRSRVFGQLKDFKAGSFRLAQMTNAPIVPVTMVGTAGVLRPDSFLFRPGPVELYIDPPIELTENDEPRSIEELMEEVQRVMNTHLQDTRNEALNDKSRRSLPVSLLR